MIAALPYIALGLSAAGSGMSALGSYRQGQFQKGLAEQNARIADQNATAAELRGASEREQLAQAGGQLISKQRAAAGAGGADVQSGSIVDVIASTRLMSRLDIDRSEFNTEMEKRGLGVQRDSLLAQGSMAEMAGAYGAASSLLTGAGSALSYLKAPKAGAEAGAEVAPYTKPPKVGG